MKYILTPDKTLTVTLSTGTHILAPDRTFNYTKIVKLLKEDAPEEQVQKLLDPVPCPDGLFRLHQFNDLYMYDHIANDGNITETLIAEKHHPSIYKSSDFKVIGIYPSLDDLMYDYPELFL